MRGVDRPLVSAALPVALGFFAGPDGGGGGCEGSREARTRGPSERRDSAAGPSDDSELRWGSQTVLLRLENSRAGPGGGPSPAHAA